MKFLSKLLNKKGENTPCAFKPVLLVFFNRPDYTKKVFEEIRKAKVSKLYLASDGWRNEEEQKIVMELREWILAHIDWECEVKTLFRYKNVGCGVNMSGSITWFFENEESGIIFEDDCVPSQSFFSFCSELLDKYKNCKKVWGISGNMNNKFLNIKHSYLFSRLTSGWGWATWRDRWQYFNFNLTGWNDKFIYEFSDDVNVQRRYKYIFDEKKKGDGLWAFQLCLLVLKNKGLWIHPANDLVSNIGVNGVNHTNAYNDPHLNTKAGDIHSLVHPLFVRENKEYTQFQLRRSASIPFAKVPKYIKIEQELNELAKQEHILLCECVKDVKNYLEFGAGNVSLFVLKNSKAKVYSVDNTAEVIEKIKSSSFANRCEFLSGDIKRLYDIKMDTVYFEYFDLQLFLMLLNNCNISLKTKIVIHNFWDSNVYNGLLKDEYNEIFKYVYPCQRMYSLGVFKIREEVDFKRCV